MFWIAFDMIKIIFDLSNFSTFGRLFYGVQPLCSTLLWWKIPWKSIFWPRTNRPSVFELKLKLKARSCLWPEGAQPGSSSPGRIHYSSFRYFPFLWLAFFWACRFSTSTLNLYESVCAREGLHYNLFASSWGWFPSTDLSFRGWANGIFFSCKDESQSQKRLLGGNGRDAVGFSWPE